MLATGSTAGTWEISDARFKHILAEAQRAQIRIYVGQSGLDRR